MKQIYFFFILVWMKLKHKVMMRCSKKYRNMYEIDVAVNFCIEIERLTRLADNNEIGIDFREAVYQMRSDEYERSICCGAFTQPSAFKAHLYFGNIRHWINIRRSEYNRLVKENVMRDGDTLPLIPMLGNDDKVHFGVTNSLGKVYIVGCETKTIFHVEPYGLEI